MVGRAEQPVEIPEYLVNLAETVVRETNASIAVGAVQGLGFDSEVKVAGGDNAWHHIMFDPAYAQHWMHFMLSGLVKIQRIWRVEPDQRLLPVMVRDQLPEYDELELRGKLGEMVPPETIAGLSKMMYRGLVRQVTSMPFDIRVEYAIARGYDDHTARQHAYLEQQIQDLEPMFSEAFTLMLPDRVYLSGAGMNVSLVDASAEITSTRAGPRSQTTRARPLGEHLSEILRTVNDPTYHGDRQAIDRWAGYLGIRDWYEWKRLDEID